MMPSQHVGKVGERVTLTVRLIWAKEFAAEDYSEHDDGEERTRWLHKFHDESESVFIWWTERQFHHADTPEGPGALCELGEPVTVEAKIKEHTDYDGVLQTRLTHVAEVQTREQKAALRMFRKEQKRGELVAAGICPDCKDRGEVRGVICQNCLGGW